MKNLNLSLNARNKLLLSLFSICFFLMSCSNKGAAEARLAPSVSTPSTDAVAVSASSGRNLPSGTYVQAQMSGSANGVKIEWIASEKPTLAQTKTGKKYYSVINIIRFNGKDFEFPTVHPYGGAAPMIAATGFFTMNSVDFDLDGECLDINCTEYALSLQVSKGAQDIQQLMVYIDFSSKAQPLAALNDKNYFMNFSQFYDLIRKYYN